MSSVTVTDARIDRLLHEIEAVAFLFDTGRDYGLPLDRDEALVEMRRVVREFLMHEEEI
jgi:hypothetical protein